jgi:colicin import membrane protein
MASKSMPVTEAAATPQIQKYLSNLRLNDAVAADMKRVKQLAKIEYEGEFARTAAENAASAQAQANAAAKSEAKASAVAVAGAKAKAEAQASADLENQARIDALAKARADADKSQREAEAATLPSKTAQLPPDAIAKGVRGLR